MAVAGDAQRDKGALRLNLLLLVTYPCSFFRGTQSQFLENICSEDDLRSRIFGTFVIKFLACLPLLRFSDYYKMV